MAAELAHAAKGIPLHDRDGTIRAFAVVDADDFERLAGFNWSLTGGGYVRRRCGTRMVKLHREILGLRRGDKLDADHKNRDRLDYRRANLRVCTRQQNRQNTSGWKRASSRYRGVSFDKPRGSWKACAKLHGRQHFIGRFPTEQEAADAAAAWREIHMPFNVEPQEVC